MGGFRCGWCDLASYAQAFWPRPPVITEKRFRGDFFENAWIFAWYALPTWPTLQAGIELVGICLQGVLQVLERGAQLSAAGRTVNCCGWEG